MDLCLLLNANVLVIRSDHNKHRLVVSYVQKQKYSPFVVVFVKLGVVQKLKLVSVWHFNLYYT
jgi:hypothetical protein